MQMKRVVVPALVASFFTTPLIAQDKTMLVLDASGSMWGQIDGKAKITIAQNTIGTLLSDLEAGDDLGLMAYGHRRKGDCGDIEVLVETGPETVGEIASQVNRISPKGKTPMASAISQAASSMRHVEDRATVILISDGVETCSPDPCAVARMLEETGVDFTAHVVGFDIEDPQADAQLTCIANETGGLFLRAKDAKELSDAMSQVVSEVQRVEAFSVSAPAESEIAAVVPISWAGLNIEDIDDDGYEVIVRLPEGVKINGKVITGPPPAFLDMPPRPGNFEIALMRIAQQQVLATRKISISDIPVDLSFPDEIEAGQQFEVTWIGPGYQTDRIGIGRAGERPKAVMLGIDAISPTMLSAPQTPGEYVVTYALSQDQHILASQPITVLPAIDPVLEAYLACMKDEARKHPDPVVQLFAQAPQPEGKAHDLNETEVFNLAQFLRSLSDICGRP